MNRQRNVANVSRNSATGAVRSANVANAIAVNARKNAVNAVNTFNAARNTAIEARNNAVNAVNNDRMLNRNNVNIPSSNALTRSLKKLNTLKAAAENAQRRANQLVELSVRSQTRANSLLNKLINQQNMVNRNIQNRNKINVSQN